MARLFRSNRNFISNRNFVPNRNFGQNYVRQIQYPFKDKIFNNFQVIFTKTTERIKTPRQTNKLNARTIQHVLPTYEMIDNDPGVLTMTVISNPTKKIEITHNHLLERVQIYCTYNNQQYTGKLQSINMITKILIDTKKYNHFVVST